MNEEQKKWLDSFNEMIDESAGLLFCTRDSDLQRNAIAGLKQDHGSILAEKDAAVSSQDEKFANVLLGCECLVSAFIAELSMWVLLKEGQPDKAWDQLVEAQTAISGAIRSDDGFAHLARHAEKLQQIEETVFPPQVFLSAGMIVKEQICSICGGDYERCDHIKGRPYMGQFCLVRLIPLEMNHVAMVEVPANKHCRIYEYSVKGGRCNRMTLKITPEPNEQGVTPEGLQAKAILASAHTFYEGFPTS